MTFEGLNEMSSQTLPTTTAAPPENAPSHLAADEPSWARTIGLLGMMLTVLGLTVVTFNEIYGPRIVSKAWGLAFIALGVTATLFHAVRDRDPQIRRAYAIIGYGLIGLMAIISLVNSRNFLSYGWACALTALCLFLSSCRHETDPVPRRRLLATLGILGVIMVAGGLIGGLTSPGFLLTYGLILTLLGLLYLCAFINQCEPLSDVGHKAGLAIGAVAVFVILYAVLRSVVPSLMKSQPAAFLVPNGLLLMFIGLVYGLVSLGIVSDWKLVVLTRRELGGFFFSPVAYIVMLSMALLGWVAYWIFISVLHLSKGLYEPIVLYYYQLFSPIVVIFVVPAITMRLLAEEKRTGTYEVLMCAPVKESTVVLSKFIAGLIFYMLLWAIWALFLIALRVESGTEFDYRPLLSFYLALALSGAGFISMGLFFSSLSKNQIIAAVLTFIGMWVIFLGGRFFQGFEAVGPMWRSVFKHLSYSDVWDAALHGQVHLREIILQGSFTFFWLFLTMKVLEARRWS